MMMRKFLIPALVASPALAGDPEFPLLAASYTLMSDVPGCDGPGETAFRVETSQTIPAWFYPASTTGGDGTDGAPAVCTSKIRRGGTLVKSVIPCEGADQAEMAGLNQRKAFCEARETLPASSQLKLQLTACLSVSRFDVMDGAWSVGSETEFGPYKLSYDFSAGMAGVTFIGATEQAQTDIYSVVASGGTSTPARLRMAIAPAPWPR